MESPAPMAMVASEVAPPAGAMTHTVIVGGAKPAAEATGAPTPLLSYNPESVKANVGDVIDFQFMPKNHTVTQSTFGKPCVKMEGGADSGFMPNPDGKAGVSWKFTVPSTDPIWMYCKQKTGNHCGVGMVFAINPNDNTVDMAKAGGDKTFAAFKMAAIAQNGTAAMTGGLQATPTDAPAAPSTVTISAAGGQQTAGIAAQPSVIPGSGQAADGSSCSCSCLCGANSFPPQAAVNNFGGFAGMMSKP
ncbi:hypothetical protein EJ05DRAFT_437168 [Pseudovirgaria hyperparasitica]|uniref:Cupredoxin n=1 Tax=Pseudovirgaria hyperparasitica TaxID=470096 RepID=A0A6A6WCL9_9PEZI|nr:uncharacterized protein EJ05DRAFT_437168 [Pseudovirgaria hyperparasitica]KAF2759596.1 hypothetical protein EJ05DRAFT_437168 [Pseudovirgaria hyperparasitica]